jgi:RNA polymerase sigma-70 factor (ECF subfamily)
VAQDAFLVVHRKAGRFDPERPSAPWFFAIVRRLAANRRARDLRRERLLRFWGWLTRREAASSQTEAKAIARLDATAVTRALTLLPPMQRRCFDLIELRGLTAKEVASMHDISEATVRQHVFRARAALRTELKGNNRESR